MTRVELWFDFASTYSYPAVMRAEDEAAKRSLRVEWKPFLLGPIFRSAGWESSPFNSQPAKAAYMWRDLARLCAKHRLPFRRPGLFPQNSLGAARIATAAREEHWLGGFVRSLMTAEFGRGRDIGDPAVVAETLFDTIGDTAADWIARAAADDVKQALRTRVERARELDIFGAPTFVVGDELFWGQDRLEDAFDWACGAHPVSSDDGEGGCGA